jgi:hypothetical protein
MHSFESFEKTKKSISRFSGIRIFDLQEWSSRDQQGLSILYTVLKSISRFSEV